MRTLHKPLRRPACAFDLLEQHLGVNERERYARRLEILGRVLFGDLWEPEKSRTTENQIEL